MLKYKRDRTWFSHLFTTSDQETERVYSYNPGARTGIKTHESKVFFTYWHIGL